MKKVKKKKRNNFEKIILIVLIIILIVLIIYAFKDKLTILNNNDSNNMINNKTQSTKVIDNKENKVDIDDNSKNGNEINDNNITVEPKKEEKDENKQQLQNNITAKIELIGSDEIILKVGEKYKELGVKAVDSNGKDITNQVSIESNVDTSKSGEYMVIYSIGKSMVIRTVIVK